MAEDFGYCWRTVRLYCPSAPTFLAREWVQTAWKPLLAARRWGARVGGLLGAFPLVAGPTLFFLGAEQGGEPGGRPARQADCHRAVQLDHRRGRDLGERPVVGHDRFPVRCLP